MGTHDHDPTSAYKTQPFKFGKLIVAPPSEFGQCNLMYPTKWPGIKKEITHDPIQCSFKTNVHILETNIFVLFLQLLLFSYYFRLNQ